LRRQLHVHARLQLGDVVAQLADAQLRAGQVAEHRNLPPDPLGGGADRLHRARVTVAVGVGEVETEDIGAGLDQAGQDVGVPTRRTNRRNDLRASATLHAYDCRESIPAPQPLAGSTPSVTGIAER